MQLGPISQQIVLQVLANLETWLECFGCEKYSTHVYKALQRQEIVFLVLMFRLIIARQAFKVVHFKALIELLGCSRSLTFDCNPH